MIFSLNKEIQAPSIYLIDNHIFFTSTPCKFHTLLSLYYVQPCKNQKKTQFTFPSSETIQESSSNENHLLMFTESHQKLSSCKKKKEKTSPRTLDYPCCIRGICRFSLNRLQRYPRNKKKKKRTYRRHSRLKTSHSRVWNTAHRFPLPDVNDLVYDRRRN